MADINAFLVSSICYVALATVVVLALIVVVLYMLARQVRRKAANSDVARTIRSQAKPSAKFWGIFHPYCNAGGGGERVLWCSVAAIQKFSPYIHSVIYTGDTDTTGEQILAKAFQNFGITLYATRISFIFLRKRSWVEAATYPHFTMLGQSLGSGLLGWEALTQFIPDVFYDSMGYAFTYPLFSLLGGCPVSCYVHYPTISSDMLSRVRDRNEEVNNDAAIANSWLKSTAKLVYYNIFARIYQGVGSYASVVLVNSTWTANHIRSIWKIPQRTFIVSPPCDTASLQQLPLPHRKPHIVSVAQFRPEKNHALQLRAFAAFLRAHPEYKIGTNVEFRINASLSELKQLLGECMVGLHTMRDEHFGIGIVEYMAAGTIALAHDSAGPRGDIILDEPGRVTGFRAVDEASYAKALADIFALSERERLVIQTNAREFVSTRFSEAMFEQRFVQHMAPLLQ